MIVSADETLRRLKWFIELERRPRTLNEAYYGDFRDQFRAHYKGWRPQRDDDPRTSLTRRISEATSDSQLLSHINDVLAGLTQMGLHGMQGTDLAKLLPPDPYDSAVEIMTSVRAYFQGEYQLLTAF